MLHAPNDQTHEDRAVPIMPTIPHVEKHFTGSASIRDVVIGRADGLTVRFALAAALSAPLNSASTQRETEAHCAWGCACPCHENIFRHGESTAWTGMP